MPVDGLPVGLRQGTQISGRLNRYCEALGSQKIAHTFGATNDHSGLRIGCYVDHNLMMFALLESRLLWSSSCCVFEEPVLHFVGRLAKCEFPKRNQGRFAKEV